jgi:hypothetical protein
VAPIAHEILPILWLSSFGVIMSAFGADSNLVFFKKHNIDIDTYTHMRTPVNTCIHTLSL